MQTLDIRHDLIKRLTTLNKKNRFLQSLELLSSDWAGLKKDVQQNLNKLKSSTKIFEILAYILLAITGVMSFIKVLGEGNWPDLNKGALLILLTITNTVTAFAQKIRVERIEKQILLIEILEKIDAHN